MATHKIPEVLTEQEQKALLSQPNPMTTTGLRNLCILRVGLNTGLRSAELTNIKVKDIDWSGSDERAQLMVRQGKGARDRVAWLGREDLALLKAWLTARPVDSPYLFSTMKGGQLDTCYLRAMLRRYAPRAGIDKRVSPHTLRHTFATDLYRRTRNLVIVQQALGHSNLSTTAIYLQLVNGELEDALVSFAEGR